MDMDMDISDQHRMHTLQALEAFIHTQRTLLAQQRSDIERLQRLRVDLVQGPAHVLSNLGDELDNDAFRLSEQVNCRLALPKDIDWSVFEKSDTGPLRTFARRKRDEMAHRARPSPSQRSELSELQRLVKLSRRTIIDPILARFADMSSPEPESEEEVDPVERRRRQEQQKIRALKQRQIRGCGLRMPLSSKSGNMGVFIRPDVEEDAMDVDVSIDDEEKAVIMVPPLDMDSDTPPTSADALGPAPSAVPPPRKIKVSSSTSSDTRVRRSAKKNLPPPPIFDDDEEDEDTNFPPILSNHKPPRPRKKVALKVPPKRINKNNNNDDDDDDDDDDDYGAPLEEEPKPKTQTKGRGAATATATATRKPKPETYKQAWSESEQNLLEQLLEEIPEGEKFRWQKISRAMGGRRTPRQVASRVQKYFEKLKRFGLMVDGGG